jgi:hypothetical protein
MKFQLLPSSTAERMEFQITLSNTQLQGPRASVGFQDVAGAIHKGFDPVLWSTFTGRVCTPEEWQAVARVLLQYVAHAELEKTQVIVCACGRKYAPKDLPEAGCPCLGEVANKTEAISAELWSQALVIGYKLGLEKQTTQLAFLRAQGPRILNKLGELGACASGGGASHEA